MTTSTWDSRELRKQFPECGTLRDIIKRIEDEFSLRGEVICEIRVNGTILSELDEVKFAESAASEISDLAVRSNNPADLICEALASALVFVPELEASCLKTSDAFRSTDLANAQKSFNECLEGCQWLVDTLMHLRGAASGIQQPISKPERWFEAEKIIGKVVRELSESYSKSDFVLVADLLEYELTGSLSVWREALQDEMANRRPETGSEAANEVVNVIGKTSGDEQARSDSSQDTVDRR